MMFLDISTKKIISELIEKEISVLKHCVACRAKLILLRRVHSRVIRSLWMTQVSSCGAAQCAIIKGVLFCLMDLSKFQYLENEYLEGSRALVHRVFLYCRRWFSSSIQQSDWGYNGPNLLGERYCVENLLAYIFLSNFLFYITSLVSFHIVVFRVRISFVPLNEETLH